MLNQRTSFVAIILGIAITVSGCAHHNSQNTTAKINQTSQLPAGSNMMLRAPITISDGLEVIISDVIIPPNAAVPAHYHPGEEFVYVIEGYAVHIEEGKAEQILKKGDAYVIPPEAVHSPRAGAEGARAIVFRVHVQGMPERVDVK